MLGVTTLFLMAEFFQQRARLGDVWGLAVAIHIAAHLGHSPAEAVVPVARIPGDGLPLPLPPGAFVQGGDIVLESLRDGCLGVGLEVVAVQFLGGQDILALAVGVGFQTGQVGIVLQMLLEAIWTSWLLVQQLRE